jgi:phosphatidylinositol alpha-mannosyltransferase
VLLEAMAAGTPVLASAIPGYASVLTHGREGFLVEPKSPAAFAAGIIRLLSDPSLRLQMAEAGRRTAGQYDWPIVAGKVVEYYERVRSVTRPARPPRRWPNRVGVASRT